MRFVARKLPPSRQNRRQPSRGCCPVHRGACSMLSRICALLLCLLPLANSVAGDAAWRDHPDWKAEFADRGVTGTALIYDERDDAYFVYDRARAETAFLPASTFKVFNALVALETGAVKDEYEVIRWDGVKRQFAQWNRDQRLAHAMT